MNKKNKSNWLNDQVYICIVEFFFLHKMLKEKKKNYQETKMVVPLNCNKLLTR